MSGAGEAVTAERERGGKTKPEPQLNSALGDTPGMGEHSVWMSVLKFKWHSSAKPASETALQNFPGLQVIG